MTPLSVPEKQNTLNTLINGDVVLKTQLLSVSAYQEMSFLKKILKIDFKKNKCGFFTRKPVVEITISNGIFTEKIMPKSKGEKEIVLFTANVYDIRCDKVINIVKKNRLRISMMTVYGQERIYEADKEDHAALDLLKLKYQRLLISSTLLLSNSQLDHGLALNTETCLLNEILRVGYEDEMKEEPETQYIFDKILGFGYEKNPYNLNLRREKKGKYPVRKSLVRKTPPISRIPLDDILNMRIEIEVINMMYQQYWSH
ncbi:hypothetical protein HK098_000466 [Nowakowskiella sp. JEL0407]|nr:hypothetical protein HK098_000466 [Nowakowskiella sp. JEL0407]